MSLYASQPETLIGNAVNTLRTIPVLVFPHGTGGPGGVGVADGRSDMRAWMRADEGVTIRRQAK